MLDAVLMAKHCNGDLFFRSERPATPLLGGLDVGSATIGRLRSTVADRKNGDQRLENPGRHEVSRKGESCDATGASTSMHTICP
jgi:hypothetical protein